MIGSKKPKDWVLLGAIFVSLGLFIIFLGDQLGFMPGISTIPLLLFVGIGVIFYIVLTLLGFAKTEKRLEFEDIFLILLALGIIGFIVYNFDNFSPYLTSVLNP